MYFILLLFKFIEKFYILLLLVMVKNSLFLGIELNRICLKEDKYYNI